MKHHQEAALKWTNMNAQNYIMERLVCLSIHSLERDMYFSAFTIHNNRPKRKSLTIGELENSGLRRTQLETDS